MHIINAEPVIRGNSSGIKVRTLYFPDKRAIQDFVDVLSIHHCRQCAHCFIALSLIERIEYESVVRMPMGGSSGRIDPPGRNDDGQLCHNFFTTNTTQCPRL